DKTTGSMQRMFDETERRRTKQLAYNKANNIVPQSIAKSVRQSISLKSTHVKPKLGYSTDHTQEVNIAADPIVKYMNDTQLKKLVKETEKRMKEAAKDLDFIKAAVFRDEIAELKKMIKNGSV
ncbi:MAG: UvrB/UvrC motif-containing protein, partial [Candidatus Cloacimonetes bacterium]|nr:UvrB/UvrC motif-containing protein [Candidatus Cloacimonadota bacterium]MDY0230564.1 UvrB/UvrC motif-containing protein [Candidatus Cloacimonadaceae bacterium]